MRPGRSDAAHGLPHQKRPRAAVAKESLTPGRAGTRPVGPNPPPPPPPPARPLGSTTREPCPSLPASALALRGDDRVETTPGSGGRKRGAVGPAALASPAMDLEETEGEPDVCMYVPVESGPSQALPVVTIESSSDETPDPSGQRSAASASQEKAVLSVGGLPNSPMPQVPLGEAPTSPADSSSGSDSSSESSTRQVPGTSRPACPPAPPAPSPPSSSSACASYSPSPISIDLNEL